MRLIFSDRGSALSSRLANYHPERFIAFAFLSVCYMPPSPDFDLDAINNQSIQLFGYPCFGYWHFYAREDAAEIIEAHVSTTVRLLVAYLRMNKTLTFLDNRSTLCSL